MKKRYLACFLSLLSSLSMADPALNQYSGSYAEINLGTNLYYLGIISTSGTASGSGVTGAAVSAAFGHYFNQYFALEGGVIQDFVEMNSSSSLTAPFVTTRFTVPLGDCFSFIGKLGLMVPFVVGEGGLVLPYTGIGLSYALNSKVDISLQYQGAIYGVAGAGVAGLGFTYHF